MTALTADAFPAFFRGVRNYDPFPWQRDLTARLLADDVPPVIDVPTGLGKTSVILCWAYALAAQAQVGQAGLPRRLCFVVDRRLIVDSAYEDAQALARALAESSAEPDGVLAAVASGLRSLHASDGSPLEVVRMRGGVTWESRWLERPDQAAVVVGTVDQFGSRALFRGYGVSEGMRPINAALVGLDAWLVVDEAHIAEPLRQTVESVVRHQQLTEAGAQLGLRPLRYTLMSATVGKSAEGALVADPAEQAAESEEARRRLDAVKPAALIDLTALATPRPKQWREQAEELGRELANLARGIPAAAHVVGVIANTIASARAAHNELRGGGEEAILLIGRVREHERDELLRRWLPTITADRDRSPVERLYVVATQTIEVGANVDFDALVTECAPLSALIQRFGRVNRLGLREPLRSLIVRAGSAHEDDRVYGTATSETWTYLGEQAALVEVKQAKNAAALIVEAPTIDFGLRPARALSEGAPPGVREEPPFTPIALGAHLERWAATSPAPEPDQAVAPFLHGVGRDTQEVSIAWRAAPPGDPDEAAWSDWLELVPPVEWEFVTVPIWAARALVAATASPATFADVEGALVSEEDPPTRNERVESAAAPDASPSVLGVVYRGRREAPSFVRAPGDVGPDDHVVLDARVGGHDEWGWTGRRSEAGASAVPDVGDLAPTRRSSVLRLARSVLSTLVPADQAEALDGALALLDPEDLDGSTDRALAALRGLIPDDSPLQPLLAQEGGWAPRLTRIEDGGHPVVLLIRATSQEPVDAHTDSDEASTSQTGALISLSRHGEEVGAMAREFAEHLGLPAQLVRCVELAGRWHDLGKADMRFQVMLHDGDELAAKTAAEPLAKSARGARDPGAREARRLAGLPSGFRHEAASARLFDAIEREAPQQLEGVDPELVRHLIVSHHGKARPLLPPLLDRGAPPIELPLVSLHLAIAGAERQVDWAQPARFEALCERYGWWGLAYLETIVRLADMLCSARGATLEHGGVTQRGAVIR